MSKYDVEVESRLKKLEAAVAALQKDSHPDRSVTSDLTSDHDKLLDLEAKVNKLWN